VQALNAHLERQLREIGILGDRYQDQGLLFTTGTGGPINPSNLRKRSLAPLLKKAQLPRVRFHDLRHTCATLLLTQGDAPQVRPGASRARDHSITLDTYSHVIPSMGDQTARAMQNALSPSRTRSPDVNRVGVRLVSKRAGTIPALCSLLAHSA
jgi:integrase